MTEHVSMRALPLFMFLALFCLFSGQQVFAANAGSSSPTGEAGKARISTEEVMQQFSGDDEEAPERRIDTKRKHQILFLMGISLLVLLFITGGLGLAMVVFDKEVFVAHMISAGLSLTLATVHAVTSIVWFWPY